MGRKGSSQPRTIDDVLPGVLQAARTKHEALDRIRRRWKRLAGATLASNSQPVAIRRGVVYVQAADPGTSFALSFEKARLLAALNDLVAGGAKDLVIRAGRIERE